MPTGHSVIARRGATRSVLPLAVIVVAFFLPAARDCDAVVSPADLSFQAFPWFLWLVPVYLGAGLLLASVVLARIRKGTPRGALGMVTAMGVMASWGFVALAFLSKGDGLPAVAGELTALVLAGVCVVRALRRRGWTRFIALVDAYLFSSFPVAVLNVLAGEYWGAWVFLAAYAALLVVRGITFAAMFQAKCGWESLARLDIQGPSLRG